MPKSRFHPWLVMLLCVTLLLRVGGAHLHLCFDGTEPPASLHLFEDGPHHETLSFGFTHQDVDIAVVAELLSKSNNSANDLPLTMLLLASLLGFWFQPQRYFSALLPPFHYASKWLLRPPLRGPPLPTSL